MSRVFLGLVLALFQAAGLPALEVPKLQSRVTDLAGILSPEEIETLDAKLKDLEETDSTQIAVVIIPSLEGESLEEYSIRVASSWRLGQKGRDNGALLLVAMKERKVRIEIGYGLEPTLTDLRSHRIIQDEIVPQFRDGNYYGGIDRGITAMIETVRGTYQPPARRSQTASRRAGRWNYEPLVLLLFPILWILSRLGKWGGGILGAGAGIYMMYSLRASLFLPTAILMIFGGLVGAFLGAMVGALIRAGSLSRGRGGFIGPFLLGGGGRFRGGFSGGGGGFSGGGGGFGGGGSSGSW